MLHRYSRLQEKQKQAMDQLRMLSESPWEIDGNNSGLNLRQIKKGFFVNKPKISVQRRPATQQQCRKNINFNNLKMKIFEHKSQPVYQNLITSPTTGVKNQIIFTGKFSKTNDFLELKHEPSPFRIQLKKRRDFRKNNYSDLRRRYQKQFFIGAKSVSFDSKKQYQSSKSIKKGRLWVGRPILLFNSQQINLNPK